MNRTVKRLSITLVLLFVSVCGLLFFLPIPPLLEDMSFSRAVYDQKHRLLRLTLSQDDKFRLFTPLNKMSAQLVSSTLLQEDQYFYRHPGVNPLAMIKASWQTYFLKSRRMGASTITMQVARIRFHINSKHFFGKVEQIIRALQIEMHYSKNQILEAYLNLAPYGNNIEGVGAASLIYFGKPVKDITLPEVLVLTVIPQNPILRTPREKNLQEARNKLFMRWVKKYPEDLDKKNLIQLPLQMQSIRSLPFLAPHFVNSVLNHASSEQQELVTTIDMRLQKITEYILRLYLTRKKYVGANNAAILLVDVRDLSIKAAVGSGSFFNTAIQGQINGTDIKRSPGSTLKPFIYGLALDQSLIHPNTLLKDVPHSFGSYNPENFDYDFMGPVKAKDALILSRNIPAIYLASKLSHPNLYELLESARISQLKAENYYGLSLVLGGAELTMQELTSLYVMLVNEGIWRPLQILQNQTKPAGKRLLSPEASFLVLDMLKNTSRAGISTNRSIPVAWKTGTSSGYRDAWTVGAFGPYVLAVWIGNFNNQSNPAFVGRSMAGPLFFEIIDAINNEVGPLPNLTKNPNSLHLTQVAVCKDSGMLPTRNCHDTETTWFIPGKSPIETDTIHREIAIDKSTGLRTCHIDKNTQFEIYEFWPSDLLKIFKAAGLQRRSPPPFDSRCDSVKTLGLRPQISSPKPQLSYVIRASAPKSAEFPLTAVVDGDVRFLHWFINENYLGKVTRDQLLIWHAKPGKFMVRVVDDYGRSDAIELLVKMES